MNTSRTSFLSKPAPGERVSLDTFVYWRSRAKREAYNLVIREFKKSGITKTELARRLGKTLPEVSRMLGGPANWTIATVSDLLFAICSGVPEWNLAFPLDKARRNHTRPSWLEENNTPLMKIASSAPSANTAAPQVLGSAPRSQPMPSKSMDYGAQLAGAK